MTENQTLADVKIKSVDIKEKKVIAVVSSISIDRDYEVMNVQSLRLPTKDGGTIAVKDLTGNETNLDIPMLLNHDLSDVENTIGSVRKAYLMNGELVFEFGISKRAKAQDMFTLIEEGHLNNAFSISVHDYDFEDGTISGGTIIECSLVTRGSNKDARVLAVMKSLGKDKMSNIDELKAKLEEIQKEIDGLNVEQPVEEVQEEAEKAVDQDEVAEAEIVEEAVEEKEEIKAEEVAEKAIEEPKEKEIKMDVKDVVAKQIKDVVEVGEVVEKKFDKVDLMAKQFSAWVNKDSAELEKLNKIALDSFKSKATYMNTGVQADGGAIVPSNEFLTDVFTTLGDYSSIANDLRVITIENGNGLDIASLLTDVVMTEVANEGGSKAVTKPVFGDGDISVREFAGIAIVTKKLVRQAAVNVYEILRESFARAIANKRAELALTDATSGIINKAGVTEVEIAGTTPTWAEIKSMPYKVTAGAAQGGKYYISRELLESLDGYTVNGVDQSIVELDGNGLSGRFKNGYAFAVEEVLTGSGVHAVFGNASRYGILLRQGVVENETFDSGIVVDGSSVEHNLLQQNKLANRVAFYENVGYPIPAAFAVAVVSAS